MRLVHSVLLFMTAAESALGDFIVYTSRTTADLAHAACQTQGMDLAVIQSEEDNAAAFAAAATAGVTEFWIGGVRTSAGNLDSDFQWRDGSPLSYSNWMLGEPNNYRSKEFCVRMGHPSQPGVAIWNDAKCNKRYSFVCSTAADATTTTTTTIEPDEPQPQSTSSQPQSTSSQPQSTSSQPQSTSSQPQSTSSQPQSPEDEEGSATEPEDEEGNPATSTRAPQEIAGWELEFHAQPARQVTAAATCAESDGYLASFNSVSTLESAYATALGQGFSEFWTGGVRVSTSEDSDADWEWSSGMYAFGAGLPDNDQDGYNDLWLHGLGNREPNNYRNRENCIRVGHRRFPQLGAQFNDANCYDREAFFCMIPIYATQTTTTTTVEPTTTTTSTTTTSTTTTTEEPPTTPPPTTASPTTASPTTLPPTTAAPTYPEDPYVYTAFTTPMTFQDAVDQCAALGGFLPAILGQWHWEEVNAAAAAQGLSEYWIYVVRQSESNRDVGFISRDHIAAQTIPLSLNDADSDGRHDYWARREPNNFGGGEDCVLVKRNAGRSTGWNDARCSRRTPFMCAIATTTTTPVPTTTTTSTTTTTEEPTTTTPVPTTTTTSTTTTSTTTTEEPTTTTTSTTTTTEEPPSFAPTTLPTMSPTNLPTYAPTQRPTRYRRPTAPVEAQYSYYQFYEQRRTWSDAESVCIAAGGELAVIRSVDVNSEIFGEAISRGMTQYWIGGMRNAAPNNDNDDSGFSWIQRVTLPAAFGAGIPDSDADGKHDLWFPREPNNFKRREDCVRVGNFRFPDNALWNDAPCNQLNSFVCGFEQTTTTTTEQTTTTTTSTTTTTTEPTTTTTSTTTTSTTTTTTEEPPTTEAPTPAPTDSPTVSPTEYPHPESWTHYADTDCWYGNIDVRMTYMQAQEFCNNEYDGAWLANPQTLQEAQFIWGLYNEYGRPRWIGGYRTAGDASFESSHRGYPFSLDSYNGWYADEPNRRLDQESCVQLGLSRRRADVSPWLGNDADCSATNNFICTICVPTTSTTTLEPTTTTSTTTTTTEPTTTTTTEPTTTTTSTTTTTPVPTTTTTPEPTNNPTPSPTMSPTYDTPEWPYFEGTGCWYKQFNNRVSSSEAVSNCIGAYESSGITSFLATVESPEEAAFVVNLEGSRAGKPRWLGMTHDVGTNTVYSHENGGITNALSAEDVTSLFYPREPSGEDCVQQGLSSRRHDIHPQLLNDANCDNRNAFVCEWCMPTTTTTSTTTTSTTTTTTEPTTTTTEVPTTTELPTTTEVTTTTTTTVEPATAGGQGLSCPGTTSMRMAALGDILGRARATASGRVNPLEFNCAEVCQGRVFSWMCEPCPLSALDTEARCLSPGPFGQGELCQANGTPCCSADSSSSTCTAPQDCACEVTMSPLSERIFADGVCQSV